MSRVADEKTYIEMNSPLTRKVYKKKSDYNSGKRKTITEMIHAEKFKKYGGKNVKVVIIDTGIDAEHPETKDSIKFHINMFEKSDNSNDTNGHGTHVAGLIAGKNVGLAPQSDLYISKSLNHEGVGTVASVMDGITMAINLNADIICMSLGSSHKTDPIIEDRLQQATNAGILIVSATGNDSFGGVDYPSRLENVISVGGGYDDGSLHIISNCGYEMDVVVPCHEIFSSYKDGQYATITGTSMATAIMAGALSLVVSYFKKEHEYLSKKEIHDKIISTLRSGNHSYHEGYEMNLNKFLQKQT